MGPERTYQFPFASYPAVRLALLLMAGMAADYHLDPPQQLWQALTFLSLFTYGWLEYRHSRKISTRLYSRAIISYLLAVSAFGGAWHASFDKRDLPPYAEIINSYIWEEIQFEGTVFQRTPTATGKVNLDMQVDITYLPDSLRWDHTYTIRVLADPALLPQTASIEIGRRMHFSATIYPLDPPRNPHEFDYQNHLYSRDIYARAGMTRLISLPNTSSTSFGWLAARRNVLDLIDQAFSESAAPLAKALLLGNKQELTPETRTSFSRAGLSHIMAVSGLHVGFLLIPFWLCIPYFWTRRYGKHLGLLLLILMLFGYAGLTGFTASVTRASLAGGFLVYARLFHKVHDSRNLMAVAAIIILLLDPGDLFTIGFQLSFSAVYIILLIMPVLNSYLPEGFARRWYGKIGMVVLVSLQVQAGLFPLLTYYFGEFSLIGPLTNALVIPLLGIMLPCALALLALAAVLPAPAQLLMLFPDLFLSTLSRFAGWSASLSWSWIPVTTNSLLLVALWAAGLSLLASLNAPRRRWKILVVLLAGLCLQQGLSILRNLQPAALRVTVLDVGQGDASLVQTPRGRQILIDTGRWQPDYNSARSIIIPHLKAEGTNRLDGIFLSHPHADHIGGILDLMKAIPVDTIYYSGAEYDSQLYRNFHRLARRYNIPLKTLSAGDEVILDSSMRMLAYGPGRGIAGSSNINNRSLILELVYGETEFLFMGDAEASQERRLLSDFKPLTNTDFLKVGHHGSNSSSTPAFLLQSTPDIAVISAGKTNRFRHPHRQAVNRLRNFGADVYFTSLQGALIFESDGRSITHREWK